MAFTYQGVRQVLRWIPAGTFMMGSSGTEQGHWKDEVLHQVTLTKGFWLAETTVTQALWRAVKSDNPSHFKGDNRPVEQVSWNDAQAFIQQLNTALQTLQPEYALRLPSEAEWEYACRAGNQTRFNFDGTVSLDKVNYRGVWDDSNLSEGALQETAEVKSYPCNVWGLYEMHGNVWEWCQDNWTEQLAKNSVIDPIELNTGSARVIRGGSWNSVGRLVRSAVRSGNMADNRLSELGFRLALSL
jgi:formylglycine-generating enzyme required for sulfatase activity